MYQSVLNNLLHFSSITFSKFSSVIRPLFFVRTAPPTLKTLSIGALLGNGVLNCMKTFFKIGKLSVLKQDKSFCGPLLKKHIYFIFY